MFYFTYLNYYYFHCKITALQLCSLNVVILHVHEGRGTRHRKNSIGQMDRKGNIHIFLGGRPLISGRVELHSVFMRVVWGNSH